MEEKNSRNQAMNNGFAATYDRFIQRQGLLPRGLAELVGSYAPGEILEFGVGTGTVAVGLSILGHKVTGVDLSRDMLKEARRKAHRHGVSVELKEGDMVALNLNRQFGLLLFKAATLIHVRAYREHDVPAWTGHTNQLVQRTGGSVTDRENAHTNDSPEGIRRKSQRFSQGHLVKLFVRVLFARRR